MLSTWLWWKQTTLLFFKYLVIYFLKGQFDYSALCPPPFTEQLRIILLSPFCSKPRVASESSSSSSPFLIKASSTGTSSLASCPSSSSTASQRLQGKKYLKTIKASENLCLIFIQAVEKSNVYKHESKSSQLYLNWSCLQSPEYFTVPFQTTQWSSMCKSAVCYAGRWNFAEPVALIWCPGMIKQAGNNFLCPVTSWWNCSNDLCTCRYTCELECWWLSALLLMSS